MKTTTLILSVLALLLMACEKETDTYNLNPENIAGIVSSEVILDANITYYLDGALVIENGGVLRIPAGTHIIAKGNTVSYVAVARGGQIYATGTEQEPVVFTSDIKLPGSWGGLVICGRAPTNFSFGASGIANAEVADMVYGGNEDDDNSGILTYVRVEYSGYSYNGDKQFNGFSFFGVGSQTTVHHISSYESADDGIEFFGGYFNANYIVSINSHDDGIDFTDGWQGKGEYWYAYNSTNSGIEGSNNESGGSRLEPVTSANLKNITVYKMGEYPWFLKSGSGIQTVENLVMGGLFADSSLPYFYYIEPQGTAGDAETVNHILAQEITFTNVRLVNQGNHPLISENSSLVITTNDGASGAGLWTDDDTLAPSWLGNWALPE